MIGRVAAATGAVVVLAVAAVGVLSGQDDGGKGPAPEGVLTDPLTTAAKVIKDEVRAVALPAEPPAQLRLLLAWTDANDTEVHFAAGTQNVHICQAKDLTDSTCDQDDVTLILEEVTPDGQTWQVVLLPDDIQNGTADPAETIEWWTNVTYTTTAPGWINELAAAD